MPFPIPSPDSIGARDGFTLHELSGVDVPLHIVRVMEVLDEVFLIVSRGRFVRTDRSISRPIMLNKKKH